MFATFKAFVIFSAHAIAAATLGERVITEVFRLVVWISVNTH